MRPRRLGVPARPGELRRDRRQARAGVRYRCAARSHSRCRGRMLQPLERRRWSAIRLRSSPSVLRPHLASKLAGAVGNSRSAYNGMKFDDEATFRWTRPRIAFRDIARATDTRTTIPCLLPPGTCRRAQGSVVVQRQGVHAAEAFLLGVMSSIPFDWGARRWVELHLTFELLNAFPVPLYDPARSWAARRRDRWSPRRGRRPLCGLGVRGRRSGRLGEDAGRERRSRSRSSMRS